jgi:hypothetical protein
MAKEPKGGFVKHPIFSATQYEVIVKEDDSCRGCVHEDVCTHDMSKLCVNFMWGTSAEDQKSCQCCTHRYTRYDPKQPIPCFKCSAREERTEPTGFWKISEPSIGLLVAVCSNKWKDACLETVPKSTAHICSAFFYEKAKGNDMILVVESKKAIQKLKESEAEHAES